MFLDFAEDQARRCKQIFLRTWQTRLEEFLRLNERASLPDAGKVAREEADTLARQEYERFAACRRADLEHEAEVDTVRQLEGEVKKLTEAKRPRRKGP